MNTSYDIDFEFISEENRPLVEDIFDLSLLDVAEIELY